MLNQHQTIKDNIAKYNKPNPLADFLISFIGDKKEVNILDVGSGAYSVIGTYLDDVKLDVYHLDNQDFTEFYNRYDVTPYREIIKGDMGKLEFLNNYFDIVCCINALDHTNSAYAAVSEMIRVCKIKGWVYIDCHLDQKDTGHKHKWNAKADGTFSNGVEQFNLKDFGFDVKFIDNGGESRYNRIIATFKKV